MRGFFASILVLSLAASGCTAKQKRNAANKNNVAEFFERCAARDGVGCYRLAMAAETVSAGAYVYSSQPNFNITEAYQTAITLLDKECAASQINSCRYAGHFYQKLGHKSQTRDSVYSADHANRINPLTGTHETGRWPLSKGYEEDRKMAVKYYTQGCLLSSAESCQELGDALSKAPVEDLTASEKAYYKAVDLFLKKCESGAKRLFSCDKATHILVYSINTPQSVQKGVELSHQGCEKGFAKDCSRVGAIHINDRFRRKNKQVAKSYYRRACDLDKNYCKGIQKLEQGSHG